MQKKELYNYSIRLRVAIGVIAVCGLVAVFLFQRFDWYSLMFDENASAIRKYLVNKSIRFLLNDIFGVLLVMALLGKRKYVIMAIWVQVAGFVFVLLPYIALKINYPHYNGPLISFLHRLVLNPILIYLLLFFLWYQERSAKVRSEGNV